jgi:hypothetical protein
MAGKTGLTLPLALIIALGLAPMAMAHGKAVQMGAVEDAAKVFGDGVKLVPLVTQGKDGSITWSRAIGKDGAKLGLVGVAKEETEHGYLAHATCLSPDNRVISVILLRVMEDEKTAVTNLTKTKGWWEPGVIAKPEGAAVILLKSVQKVKNAAVSIPK